MEKKYNKNFLFLAISRFVCTAVCWPAVRARRLAAAGVPYGHGGGLAGRAGAAVCWPAVRARRLAACWPAIRARRRAGRAGGPGTAAGWPFDCPWPQDLAWFWPSLQGHPEDAQRDEEAGGEEPKAVCTATRLASPASTTSRSGPSSTS